MTFEYDIENDKGELLETLSCEARFCGYRGEKPEIDRLVIRRGARKLTDTEVNFYFGLGTYEAIRQYALDHVDPREEAAL